MKKTLTVINGALTAQCTPDARPSLNKNADTTFGLYQKQDGRLGMGNKVVRLDVNGKTLLVDGAEYKLTLGHNIIVMLIKYINHSLHRPR